MRKIFLSLIVVMITLCTQGQTEQDINKKIDSLYIEEVENKHGSDKVLHAEPLFIDLIRDLGARKGESEWNVGIGLSDNKNYDEYTALVEYEWAPVNRLGLEVELPFSFYYPINGSGIAPGNKLNSIKLAAQYSFFVSERYKTSMAIGYIHEFNLTEFREYSKRSVFSGNTFNPFFIAARRLGSNFHTLMYTGPVIHKPYNSADIHTSWEINSNFHYMIPGTRNFIGIEFNKSIENKDFDMTLRPQMRVGIADNLLVGIVTGIPVARESQRFSSFIRLIYEPGHKK